MLDVFRAARLRGRKPDEAALAKAVQAEKFRRPQWQEFISY